MENSETKEIDATDVKEKEKIKPFLNLVLDKVISRKLSVLIVATYLLFYDKLSDNFWTYIAVTYMGVQGAIDILKAKASTRR